MQADHRETAFEPAGCLSLRLMVTSDVHGHLLAYDYAADRPHPGVGLARVASLVAQARAETPNSLLLDNGDFLFGSMLADAWASAPGPRPVNPVIAAMNALRYDAVGLGNHEFNFGLELLAEALGQAVFPALCANVAPLGPDVPLPVSPGFLLRRDMIDEAGVEQTVGLGLVSVLPPQVMQWDARHLSGRVAVRGMVQTVRDEVAALRARGADLVIVLNHSGLGKGTDNPQAENAGLALARLQGVDIVLCGHRHQVFPGPYYAGRPDVDAQAGTLAGVPASMPGSLGSHLAVMDLDLLRNQAGWRVARHRTSLRAIARRGRKGLVARVCDAPGIAASAARVHDATLVRLRQTVGRIEKGISTHFSQVAPCPVSALVAAAQAWHVCRSFRGQPPLPVISAAAPFRCGGTGGPGNYTNLPAGNLRLHDIGAIYPFPNTVRAVRVTGAQLLEWIEHCAGQFRQLRPGDPHQSLLDERFPGYNFDILHGLSYVIDPMQPARYRSEGRLNDRTARRVRDATWNGAALHPEAEFLALTNSYRADGGGNVSALADAPVVLESDAALPEVIADYLRAGHGLPKAWPQPWRFAPLPGITAAFRTGPGAPACPMPGLCPEGLDDDGFARFRIHL